MLKTYIEPEKLPEGSDIDKPIDRDEVRFVADRMIKSGGNFEKGLGYALYYADKDNTNRIYNTWPEIIKKYKESK